MNSSVITPPICVTAKAAATTRTSETIAPSMKSSSGVHAVTSSAPIPALHRRDVWLGGRRAGAVTIPDRPAQVQLPQQRPHSVALLEQLGVGRVHALAAGGIDVQSRHDLVVAVAHRHR